MDHAGAITSHAYRWHSRNLRGGHRRIRRADQTTAARLPGDSHPVGVSIAVTGVGLDAMTVSTSVREPDLDAPLLVHGHVEKVEHVARDICLPMGPDRAALNRVVRRGVGRCPMRATVKSVGYVKMPYSSE